MLKHYLQLVIMGSFLGLHLEVLIAVTALLIGCELPFFMVLLANDIIFANWLSRFPPFQPQSDLSPRPTPQRTLTSDCLFAAYHVWQALCNFCTITPAALL